MDEKKEYSFIEAEQIGNALGIDWNQFGIEQFRTGLQAESQDGASVPQIKVDHKDALITGKIALAHLHEFSEYYTRLAKMEKEADEFWADV
jgi:hypothetical protein